MERAAGKTPRGGRPRPWSAGKFRSSGSPVAPTSVAVLHKHQKHISRQNDAKSSFLDREINAVIQGQYVDDHTRSTCPACTSLHAERCNYCLRGKSSTAPRMHLHELGQALIQAAKKAHDSTTSSGGPQRRHPGGSNSTSMLKTAAAAASPGRQPSPDRPVSPNSPNSPKSPKSPKTQEVGGPNALTPESLLNALVLYGRSSQYALEMNDKLEWPKRSSTAVHQHSRKWCVKHYDQYSDAAEYTAGLEKEKSRNKAVLRKASKKLVEKSAALVDVQSRLRELEEIVDEERVKNAELQQQNDDLCKYLDRCARDKIRITELEDMNGKLKMELNSKLQELAALFLKEAEPSPEHQAEVRGLNGQIKVLKSENSELKAEKESFVTELAAAREEGRGAARSEECKCDELRREIAFMKANASLCAKCGCAVEKNDPGKQATTKPQKKRGQSNDAAQKKRATENKANATDVELDRMCRGSKSLCPLGKLLPKNAEKKPAPIPPKSCLKELYEILEKKVLADIADEQSGTTADTLPEFLDDYFQHKYGLKKMADEKVKSFLQSLVKHNSDVEKAEAKGSNEQGKVNHRYGFLLDALGLRNERLWSRDSSDLFCLLLRRAFHKNIQGMSERLDDGPHECFVPLETALDMVYGPIAKRGDAGRWEAPQLWKVANAHQIEQILDDIEELEPVRIDGRIHVDLDDVLEIVLNGYQQHKAEVQRSLAEAAKAYDIDENGLELEEFQVFLQLVVQREDLSLNGTKSEKKALTDLWKGMLSLTGAYSSSKPVAEQSFTDRNLFQIACVRSDIYPWIEKPKPLMETGARTVEVSSDAAQKIKELKKMKKK